MSDEFKVHVFGLLECRAALLAVTPKLRNGIVRNALASGARIYRDQAKRLVPILRVSTATRKPGTVRDAIKVRTSKRAKRQGDVGVFVNVLPAKGAKFGKVFTTQGGFKTRVLKSKSQRGAKSPNDPFYWRFLEFGTKKMGAYKFLTQATKKTGEVVAKITAELTKAMAKLNQRGGK